MRIICSIAIMFVVLLVAAAPARAQSPYSAYNISADSYHFYAGTGASDTLKAIGFATIHGGKGFWTEIIVAVAAKTYRSTASRIRVDLCRDGVLRGRFYFGYGGGASLNFRADSISVHKTVNTDTVDVYLMR